MTSVGIWHLLFLGVLPAALGTERGSAIDFNRDIRPILSENCFFCHGQDANTRQAGLRLDLREEAIDGGALVPGNPKESSLLQRVLSDSPDEQMPPPNSHRKVSEEQKKLLARWIESGGEYSTHWAFSPPQRPEPPPIRNEAWVRNPIDRFVLSKLEVEGLAPSPEADRRILIKRLYADLLGLPPTKSEIEAFVNDSDPNAYENLVDSLMGREQYGERMALPWLDAARYADSNGFQQDGDTWQWMWRDWVVQSLNKNMPFDQFTLWQLAGDLLPDATVEQKIASGFNRNHLLNGEGGAIAEEQRFNILFDRMDTTATVFLGLTMACAQCHDHKYDPITQRDYYRLMDAFNRVPETGTPQFQSRRIRVGRPFIDVPNEEVTARIAKFDAEIGAINKELNPLLNAAFAGWKVGVLADKKPAEGKEFNEALLALLAKPEGERSDEDRANIDRELRAHFNQKVREALKPTFPKISEVDRLGTARRDYINDQMPRPMVMSDEQPRDTHVLLRGEYLSLGDKVNFGTPEFLPPMGEDLPRNRLGLAKWLLSPEQPLTSRVQVNRMWLHFFNVGLVKTVEDFGVQSEYPFHRELLDWLAVEFRENGWDMKALNRLIVTSATYRQSSRFSPVLKSYDPENKFYARANRFRMPAMVLRDWALATGSLIDQRIGGKPVYPYQPDGIWESLAITKERDFTYPKSEGADLYRRSLYTFWRRTVGPANMFDASNRQTCKVRPSVTSTPLHALTTLNDPTWVEAARGLAEQVVATNENLDEQLTLAFETVLCRPPAAKELELLRGAYQKQKAFFDADPSSAEAYLKNGESTPKPTDAPEHLASLSAVCLAIFNLDEALTRE